MNRGGHAEATTSGFGATLRHWRERRGLSQYALAEQSEVSARHLSFLETGRSRPSREMVLRLARVLDLPFRQRNALLHAAGFSPHNRETPLNAEGMAAVRHALERLLEAMGPWPSLLVDRRHDILMANVAATGFVERLSGGRSIRADVRRNALALLLSREGLADALENREEVAALLMDRLRRELLGPADAEYLHQLQRLIGPTPEPIEPQDSPVPVVALRFRIGAERVSIFSTITSVEAPVDVTLQELRVETLLPADEASKRLLESN